MKTGGLIIKEREILRIIRGLWIWRYKSSLLFILLASAVDYLVLFEYQYVPFISDITDKQILLTPLATMNSIFIATAGILYQTVATKDRETAFKIHEQRLEPYEGLLKIIDKLAELSKKKEPDIIGKIEPYWRDLRPKMIIYASPEVIKAYKTIEMASPSENKDISLTIKRLSKLFVQIRSEVGFTGEDVPNRLLLSFFINDIFSPEHDELFDENGYLIDFK